MLKEYSYDGYAESSQSFQQTPMLYLDPCLLSSTYLYLASIKPSWESAVCRLGLNVVTTAGKGWHEWNYVNYNNQTSTRFFQEPFPTRFRSFKPNKWNGKSGKTINKTWKQTRGVKTNQTKLRRMIPRTARSDNYYLVPQSAQWNKNKDNFLRVFTLHLISRCLFIFYVPCCWGL